MTSAAEDERAYEALRQREGLFALVFRASPIPITISRLADGTILDVNQAFVRLLGYEKEEVVGRTSLSLGLHVDPGAREQMVARLARDGTVRDAQMVARTRSGAIVHMLVNVEPLDLAGEACVMSTAYDLTERRRAEETIRRQAERARFTGDVSRTFAEAGLDYQGVLRVVVERTAELIGDGCVVTLVSDDGQQARVAACHHPRPEALAVMQDTLRHWGGRTDSPFFRTLLGGTPVRVAELEPDAVRAQFDPELVPYYDRVGISSLLMVPLRVQGRVIGTLGLTRDPGGAAYSTDDQVLLQDLADRAALAIENARLFRSVSEHRAELRTLSARLVETQEAERRTIARELHDEVGQLLTSLKFLLAAQDRTGAAALRRQLTETTGRILERIEDLSLNLRPPMLDDLGLVPALLWHVARYEAQTHVHVCFHHRGAGQRFAPNVELALFRLVQEALTNVARHSGAAEAHVEIWKDGERLRARVEDGGCGFDAAAVRAASSGLTGMRERAALLGGSLTVDSHPGGGVRVEAELPLRPDARADGCP